MTRRYIVVALCAAFLSECVHMVKTEQEGRTPCNTYSYREDSACYMEPTSRGQMIRSCAPGTVYQKRYCSCGDRVPPNHHYSSECWKAHQYGGHIIQYSKTGSNSQHTTQSHTQENSHHTSCEQSQYYKNLMDLMNSTRQCATLDEIINDLYQTTVINGNDMDCTNKIMKTLYNHTYHTPGYCSCETGHHYLSSPGRDTVASNCYHNHLNYGALYREIFGDTRYKRSCISHKDAWSFLMEMHDENCVRSFIKLYRDTFHRLNNRYTCHCTLRTSDRCGQLQEYKDLMTLVKGDPCLAGNKVWQPLNKLQAKNFQCAEIVIQELANTYGRYSAIPRSCQCSASDSSDLTYEKINDGSYSTCEKYNEKYSEIIHQVLGDDVYHTSKGVCQTQHLLWTPLSQLHHHEGYKDCLQDLIRHLALTMDRQKDPCSCGKAVFATQQPQTTQRPTTVTKPVTQTTTITTTSKTTMSPTQVFQGFHCDKIRMVTSVAHNSYFNVSSSGVCPDGSHRLPEAAAMELCNAPLSSSWKEGLNVLQNCNSIPMYTAVASFVYGQYNSDGISGVLVGCNATDISIATQLCIIPMNIIHLTQGQKSHYYDLPQAYFTIAV